VINLSSDKARVIREAFRVLRPGGRFAVADIVVRGSLPDEVRHSLELWSGCMAGALEEEEYRRLLADAGFTEVDVESTRVHSVHDATEALTRAGLDVDRLAPQVEGKFVSAFVRATKPRR
jgi:arsenite methyltransferase